MNNSISTPILSKNQNRIRAAWRCIFLIRFWILMVPSLLMMGAAAFMDYFGKSEWRGNLYHAVIIFLFVGVILLINYFFYKRTYKQYEYWWLMVFLGFNFYAMLIQKVDPYQTNIYETLRLFHFNTWVISCIIWTLKALSVLSVISSILLTWVNWSYQRLLNKQIKEFESKAVDQEELHTAERVIQQTNQ